MSSVDELFEKYRLTKHCQRSDCESEIEVDLETVNLHGIEVDLWLCKDCKDEILAW